MNQDPKEQQQEPSQEDQKQQEQSTSPKEEEQQEQPTTPGNLEQSTNDVLTAAASQLQQLTPEETQALIHATAQAMGVSNNYQQLFSTIDSTNVVLAASIVAAAAAASATNNNNNSNLEASKETTTSAPIATSSGTSSSTTTSNKRKREPIDLSTLPADLLKRELMNQKVIVTLTPLSPFLCFLYTLFYMLTGEGRQQRTKKTLETAK